VTLYHQTISWAAILPTTLRVDPIPLTQVAHPGMLLVMHPTMLLRLVLCFQNLDIYIFQDISHSYATHSCFLARLTSKMSFVWSISWFLFLFLKSQDLLSLKILDTYSP